MKKFKRIIGVALAAAIALSLTVTPVFAAGEEAVVPGEGIISWGEKISSTNPEVNPVKKDDSVVTGSGGDNDNDSSTKNVPGSEILVVFPDGSSLTTKVDGNGDWSVPISGVTLADGDKIKVYQTETGKERSAPTVVTVGSGKPGEPEPPIKPVDPTKFLSMSFPSKFYWYVYQASPGVVQSPKYTVVNNGMEFKTEDGKNAKADPKVKVSLKSFTQTNTLADFNKDKLVLNFTDDFAVITADLAKDFNTVTEIGRIQSNLTTASAGGNIDTLTFGFTGKYNAGLPASQLTPTYSMTLHYEVVGETAIEVA